MDQRGQRVDSRMTCEYVPSWNFLLAEIMWNSFLHNNIVQSENNKEQLHPKSPNSLAVRAARRERCVWLPSGIGDNEHSSHIPCDCLTYSVMGFVIIRGASNSFIFVKLVFHSFALISCQEKRGLSKNVLFKKNVKP